jgi:HSP20 family protein
MTLVKYRPNRNLFFPKRMNNFFDDFLTKDWEEGLGNFNSQPKVNILDKSDHYEIHFAAPGLQKSDFSIELNDDRLTISYEKKMEKKKDDEENEFTLREFSFEKFERSFTLPQSVDKGKIKADYVNGLLNILIPKTEEAKVKPVREIKVG